MDYLFLHLPYAEIDVFIPTLIFIGFCAGVISAFLGIGGAWLVTPALNILGFPMAYAIGTDIAHVGAKGLLATAYHSKRKNVDYSLALFMLAGTVVGVELGAQAVMLLESMHQIESVLRWVYVTLLSLISAVVFFEKSQKKLDWHKKLQKIFPPPYFHFKISKIHCSIWLPILIGVATGFFAGFLGIGGGLLRLPMLIYCMGCPTLIAVGTDLFEVMLSGFYGGLTYALKGRVDYLAAAFMFIGATFGVKIGVLAACQIQDRKIRNRFGIAVFGCLISVVFKQLNHPIISKFLIFSTVLFLVILILLVFLKDRELLKKEPI